MTFDCLEVTLCGWHDVKIQLLISFVVVIFSHLWHLTGECEAHLCLIGGGALQWTVQVYYKYMQHV